MDIGKELVMRKGLAKIATTVAVGSILAMTGAGMAHASMSGPPSGGSGSVTTSPEMSADAIQKLRDRLAIKANEGDVAATQQTTRDVQGVVASLQNRSEPWAARSEVRSNVNSSHELSARLDSKLGELKQANARILPGGDLLGTVNDLLKSLLTTLTGLLDGLLGGGAPPLPVDAPALPPTPAPPAP
ncbi:MAG: hypothetical protein GEU98_20730 [Pseudonocardiaceae bacterium]|nr:hypothetical protein [Pseudonocardiaceae bacterium]